VEGGTSSRVSAKSTVAICREPPLNVGWLLKDDQPTIKLADIGPLGHAIAGITSLSGPIPASQVLAGMNVNSVRRVSCVYTLGSRCGLLWSVAIP